MRRRYLLLAGNSSDRRAGLLQRMAESTDLDTQMVTPRLAVLASRNCRCLPLGERGVVVGTLFPRHGPARPLAELQGCDAEAILGGGEGKLSSAYWGGYVAAIAAGPIMRVCRDPSAALPCYFTRQNGILAFASDVELLTTAGLGPIAFDWQALARQFYNSGVPVPATALDGVEELLPGFAVDAAGGAHGQAPFWSPWDHATPRLVEPREAAERLERVVDTCVRGWAGTFARPLVSVSGGLDSSIVATILAEEPAAMTCLTMYGDDPAGDERIYARALCKELGAPLVERRDRIEDIDITEPLAAHLPRPFGRTQALTYEKAHIEVARQTAADAFVTGNGGDSVFGYSQSAGAVADRFLFEGLGGGLITTLGDVCRQTGTSAARAVAASIRLLRGPRAYSCKPDRLFLRPDIVSGLEDSPIDHPWLHAPPGALPGKAAHIASILRIQHCLEPGRSSILPVVNPLVSQPIIETCLAVPSWLWRTGGRDRAIARQAFARRLPEAIVWRRVKGGPDGFASRILDRFRSEIRARLLDGHLASAGILDLKLVEHSLSKGRTVPGEERVRLLEFLAAEAWLDSWRARMARR